MEGVPKQEKEPIKVNQAEWMDLVRKGFSSSTEEERKELSDWMDRNGLQFDSGPIEIELENGEKWKVNTDREDFGTRFED